MEGLVRLVSTFWSKRRRQQWLWREKNKQTVRKEEMHKWKKVEKILKHTTFSIPK